MLKRHFPNDADWLYVTALLRCVRPCAMRYTEHFYDVSYLSERFPGLNLSSLNLSNLMAGLGFRRVQMVAFMREFIPDRDAYMLFDGTAMACNSLNIYEAQRGYNSHGFHDPQINLVYAAVKTPETYLWEVRVTNVGEGWQLEPIPKASRNALEAFGLTPPENLPASPALTEPMA